MFGEDFFLTLLDNYFVQEKKGLLVARGDDCALIEGKSFALSSDLFLEKVHFDLRYFSLEDVGYKALAVNLSDLAAAGSWPEYFCLQLIWPRKFSLEQSEELFKGMSQLASQFKLTLIGGDLSQGDTLGLAITILGSVPYRFLPRKQAKEGDLVFLVGEIGLSRVGFLALQAGISGYPRSKQAHLRPRPLVKEGLILAQKNVKSLLDVSDGVARDIFRLLPEGLGLNLFSDLRLPAEVVSFATARNLSPLHLALEGGEDYALLGVVKASQVEELLADLPYVQILGEVSKGAGIYYQGKKLELKGFDHFS